MYTVYGSVHTYLMYAVAVHTSPPSLHTSGWGGYGTKVPVAPLEARGTSVESVVWHRYRCSPDDLEMHHTLAQQRFDSIFDFYALDSQAIISSLQYFFKPFHFNNKFRVHEIFTRLTELKSISPLWRPCFGKTVMSLQLYYSLVVLFSCSLFDCHNDYETLIHDIF